MCFPPNSLKSEVHGPAKIQGQLCSWKEISIIASGLTFYIYVYIKYVAFLQNLQIHWPLRALVWQGASVSISPSFFVFDILPPLPFADDWKADEKTSAQRGGDRSNRDEGWINVWGEKCRQRLCLNCAGARGCDGIHSPVGSIGKRCSFAAASIAAGSVVTGSVTSSVVMLQGLLVHMGQAHVTVSSSIWYYCSTKSLEWLYNKKLISCQKILCDELISLSDCATETA